MSTPHYRAALQASLSAESKAYGFTLVTWSTGAFAIVERGSPGRADVVAYLAGALVGMGVIILAGFGGPRSEFEPRSLHRYAAGAIHVVSVCAATSLGWLAALVLEPRWLAFAAAGTAATSAYQLLLALEVALSARRDEGETRT